MAQTIAEKLAEKYDVTPSTTIAGTLKKITNDETGDVNIASLVGKMEAGGSSSRLLVYENDALNFPNMINEDGKHWVYTEAIAMQLTGALSYMFKSYPAPTTSLKLTLIIDDDEELTAELQQDKGESVPYIGASDPGDTTTSEKIGCSFASGTPLTGATDRYLMTLLYVMLDCNYYAQGTHSVKIYKEV